MTIWKSHHKIKEHYKKCQEKTKGEKIAKRATGKVPVEAKKSKGKERRQRKTQKRNLVFTEKGKRRLQHQDICPRRKKTERPTT